MRRIFAVLPVLLALAVLLGSCTTPTACMEEATAFRASLQPLLKGAAFLDDAWFSEPLPPAVYATCWRLPDGRGLVLAANDTERPFALPVRPDFPCTGAACRLLGEPDARRLGAGPDGLCLTLQPGALAMLLLDGGGR